ncbi:hypothetical protein QAD02_001340 [Eretmocerus hayati]|uniref:Uncharacterized protein n=1 Tax=Eretmocerus hayati TaxID=131215 RepID=A0ACC2NGP5_9HYME|nr:hypothetical protein QAD02_001340 [Eretmocerus hayati]
MCRTQDTGGDRSSKPFDTFHIMAFTVSTESHINLHGILLETFEQPDIKQVFITEEFIKEEDIVSDESDYCEIIENDFENHTPVANGHSSKSETTPTRKKETSSKLKQVSAKRKVPKTGYMVRCPKCPFFVEIGIEKDYKDPCPDCHIPLFYQCAKCNFKKDDRPLRKHKCDVKRSFECHLCNFTTYKLSYLRSHRKSHHKGCDNPEDFLKCSRCKKSYKSKKYMIIHEKVCLPKSNWKCPLCDFETHTDRRSKYHMMKHHPESLQQ